MEAITEIPADVSMSDLRALLKPDADPPAAAAPAAAKAAKPAPAPEPADKERGADGKFQPAAKEPDDDGTPVSANVQKRIDKAVRAQREAERERDELKAAKAGTPGSQPARQTAPPAAAPGKPDAARFDTYEEYVEALTDWKLESRDAQRAAADRQRTNAAAWKEREAAARADHTDYEEVIAAASAMPINRAMHEAITDDAAGPKLAYYLATHEDETALIAKLGPAETNRALGRIMAGFTARSEPAAAPPATSKPAAAAKPLPRPPAAVGGAHAPHTVDLETCDMATFKREVAKRRAA